MPAVVKNDEDPNEKTTRQDRQGQREPPRDREAAIHQIPQQHVRNDAVDNLPESAPGRRLLITGDNRLPRNDLIASLLVMRKQIVCHMSPPAFARLRPTYRKQRS